MGMQPILPVTVSVKKIKGTTVNGDGVILCEQTLSHTGNMDENILQNIQNNKWVC